MSLQDLALTEQQALGVLLASALDTMASLQLPSMPGMTDDFILQFLQATGDSFETPLVSSSSAIEDFS
jgi:hypothetical protein